MNWKVPLGLRMLLEDTGWRKAEEGSNPDLGSSCSPSLTSVSTSVHAPAVCTCPIHMWLPSFSFQGKLCGSGFLHWGVRPEAVSMKFYGFRLRGGTPLHLPREVERARKIPGQAIARWGTSPWIWVGVSDLPSPERTHMAAFYLFIFNDIISGLYNCSWRDIFLETA